MLAPLSIRPFATLVSLALSAGSVLAQTPCTDSADSVFLGGGTAGSAGVPTLGYEGSPIVGNPFRMRVTGARPNAHGCVGFSTVETPIAIPFFETTVHPGFPLFALELFVTDASGRSPVLLDVALVDASLCGVTFVAQGMIDDPKGPNGTAFTAGRRVTLGAPGSSDTFLGPIHDELSDEEGVMSFVDLDSNGSIDLVMTIRSSDSVAVALSDGTGGYGPTRLFAVGEEPFLIDSGDFDGDGSIDLVVRNQESRDLSILINDGQGGFLDAVTYDYPVGFNSTPDLDVADVDGDGNDDILVLLNSVGPGSTIVALWGRTADVPEQAVVLATGMSTRVFASDANGDGLPDVVSASRVTNPDDAFVLLNLGARTFAAPVVTPDTRAAGVGDLDGDGFCDLFVQASSAQLEVHWGIGDGTFSAALWAVNPLDTGVVLIDDVDGDGGDELVLTIEDTAQFRIYDGNGTRSLELVETGTSVYNTSIVLARDVNEDSISDLVFWSQQGRGFAVLLGSGGGVFPSSSSYQLPVNSFDVALGDTDLDGDLDVVCAYGTVAVLLNDGNGGLSAPVQGSASDSQYLTLVQLDDDGVLDFIGWRFSPNEKVEVRLGLGNGIFAEPAFYDFDEDVRDLVVVGLEQGATKQLAAVTDDAFVELRRVLAGGTLSGPRKIDLLGGDGRRIASGDVDGDGVEDLVVALDDLAGLEVLLGVGNGFFVHAGVFDLQTDGIFDVGALEIVDFDGDGLGDVVVGFWIQEADLEIHRSTGGGQLAAPVIVPAFACNELAQGDFNGDGIADVVTANIYTGDAQVFFGDGVGGLVPGARYGSGSQPLGIAVGDMNGDGLDDAVTANLVARDLTVFLNQLFE